METVRNLEIVHNIETVHNMRKYDTYSISLYDGGMYDDS